MKARLVSAFIWAVSAVIAGVAVGCVVADQVPNGASCQKNDDCESDRCISNICHPIPKFGPPADGGSADAATD